MRIKTRVRIRERYTYIETYKEIGIQLCKHTDKGYDERGIY